jgi:hypothetical protein
MAGTVNFAALPAWSRFAAAIVRFHSSEKKCEAEVRLAKVKGEREDGGREEREVGEDAERIGREV